MAGGAVVAGAAGAGMAGRALGGATVGAARGVATVAGGASTAYQLGSAASGGSVAGGVTGVARAGASAAMSPLRRAAADLHGRFQAGGRAVFESTGGAAGSAGTAAANDAGGAPSGEPAWARAMRRRQAASHGVQTAAHALRSGDGGGAGSSVSVREGE